MLFNTPRPGRYGHRFVHNISKCISPMKLFYFVSGLTEIYKMIPLSTFHLWFKILAWCQTPKAHTRVLLGKLIVLYRDRIIADKSITQHITCDEIDHSGSGTGTFRWYWTNAVTADASPAHPGDRHGIDYVRCKFPSNNKIVFEYHCLPATIRDENVQEVLIGMLFAWSRPLHCKICSKLWNNKLAWANFTNMI